MRPRDVQSRKDGDTVWRAIFACSMGGMALAANAEFSFEDDGARLTVVENGQQVLVYNYGPVDAPKGVPERYRRACYIHPLYGLDGEVMTDDFPLDHRHHRGLYWAWPETTIGDKRADIWACGGIYQRHEAWTAKEAGADKAVVGTRNFWSYADAPDVGVGREDVVYTIHAATDQGRIIDVAFKFTNITEEIVTFLGATGKGYGGFNFRPPMTRRPHVFTTKDGLLEKDALRYETPWTDITSQPESGPVSGAAIFQYPGNPGYPHHGWIMRHYSFLGVCWPHLEAYPVKPGESFELRYRLYLHRGTAEEAGVVKAFAAYTASATE